MDRQEALERFANEFEAPVWAVFSELEKTLRGLVEVAHFNSSDPASVGNTLHGALEDAVLAAEVEAKGLRAIFNRSGPCFKLEGAFEEGAKTVKFSAELHLAGPKGATGKRCHQYASTALENQPDLPGLEADAPQVMLLFLGYHLSASATSVSRLFAIYADGIDRKKVELVRPTAAGVDGRENGDADTEPDIGAKVSIKGSVSGEKRTDGLEDAERRDASPSSKKT